MFAKAAYDITRDSQSQKWNLLFRDIPLFIFFIVTTAQGLPDLLLGTRGGSTTFDPQSGSLLTQIFIPAVLAALLLWHAAHRSSLRRIAQEILPFVPIILWIFLSVLWSDHPDLTVRRSLRFALELLALMLFTAAYRDQFKLLRVIYLGAAVVILLDSILVVDSQAFSSIGYVGIHVHKNQAGAFCFIAIPVFLMAALDRRIFPVRMFSILLLVLAIIVLVLSQSKSVSTLLPTCLALAFGFVWLGRAHDPPAYLILILVAIFCFMAMAVVFSVGISDVLNEVFGDATLTGRDRVWDYVIYQISQAPILGHGYGAVWYLGGDTFGREQGYGLTWAVEGAHNGYLDVTVQLGVVGLVLMILLLLGTIYRLWRSAAFPNADRIVFFGIFATFATIFHGITESTMLITGSESWSFFVLMSQAAYNCSMRLSAESNSRSTP
jgi:exopolysaccharide production protein ExoQ